MGLARGEFKHCDEKRPCQICSPGGHPRGERWCMYTEDGAHCCMKMNGLPVPGFKVLPNKKGIKGTVYRRNGEDRAYMAMSAVDQAKADRERDAKFAEDVAGARELWEGKQDGKVVEGWVVPSHPAIGAFIEDRGVRVKDLPGGRVPDVLRLCMRSDFWTHHPTDPKKGVNKPGPCILCSCTDSGGQVQALQRLYLDPEAFRNHLVGKRGDGGKQGSKRALGPLAGAAVRLRRDPAEKVPDGFPLDPATTLIVDEGVETGFALWAATRCEVWACISTSGFMSLTLSAREVDPVTGWVKTIIFAGDHDRPNPKRNNQRPGKEYAAIGANRLKGMYPHINIVVALPDCESAPGMVGASEEFGEGEILAPEGGEAPKSVDWEDVYTKKGPGFVVFGMAKAIGKGSPESWVLSPGSGEEGEENPPQPLPQGGAPEEGEDTGRKPGATWDRSDDSGRRTQDSGPGDGGEGKGPPTLDDLLGEFDSPKGPVAQDGALWRARVVARGLWMPRVPAGERFTIVYDHDGEQWMEWDGTKYIAIERTQVRSRVLEFFETWWKALKPRKGSTEPTYKRLALSSGAADDVVNGLMTPAGFTADRLPVFLPPVLDQDGNAPWAVSSKATGSKPIYKGAPRVSVPEMVIPLADGLWSVDAWLNGEFLVLPHTPRYVSTSCRAYTLDSGAVKAMLREDPELEERGGRLVARLAPNWMRVLEAASDGDAVWTECLGRAFGVSQTPWMQFEAMFFNPGAPGTFKGTIGEGLKAASGPENVASTSLMEVCERFEMSSWRGKTSALFTDASVGRYVDPVYAVERLARLGGGDDVGMEVKHETKDSGYKNTTHIWIHANELLALSDPSLKLSRRLVCMPTAGDGSRGRTKDDSGIKEGVKREGAGILLWAMCHLRALVRDVAAGRKPFVMPQTGVEMMATFKRLTSRAHAFLEDCCVVGPEEEVKTGVLRALYEAWAESEGQQVLSAEKFGEQLRSLITGLKRVSREGGGGATRWRSYRGVRPLISGEVAGKRESWAKGKVVTEMDGLAEFDFEFPPVVHGHSQSTF